ncbi:MAG: glycerol-3-phosphate 1-O-acyltransferase PlsY [Thermodesulfobacteriota bacterium]|nr:glycerol-3-phosphate 1-O-acyltransferase PlsY [Thermodesulfobacteriota bacterium]
MNFLFILAAYMVGAVPFGLLFGKLVGTDVRQSGSKNIGATNVSRLLGKKMGAVTLVCDAGKGFVPMFCAREMGAGGDIVLLCGGAAFLGHLYSVYLGFKGGKGVATALGVFIYLNPLAVLVGVGIFAASVALSGFVSLGSLLTTALMPLILLVLHGSVGQILLAVFIALLVWIKHKENIIRLLNHQEESWKKK